MLGANVPPLFAVLFKVGKKAILSKKSGNVEHLSVFSRGLLVSFVTEVTPKPTFVKPALNSCILLVRGISLEVTETMHFSFIQKMLNLSWNKNNSDTTTTLGNNQLSAMLHLLSLKNRLHTQFLSEQAVPQQVDTVSTCNTGRCKKLALHFFAYLVS